MNQTTLNMDYRDRLVIETGSSGNPELLLELEDGGADRRTAVLEYEPGAALPLESFPGGEELFILEGDLRDDGGEYASGTYIKNPAGSPGERSTRNGCRLFVKRNHMSPEDTNRVVVNTREAEWFPGFGLLRVLPLHEFEGQSSALVYWPPGATFQPHKHWGGEEIFVIDGVFQDEHGDYPRGTWLRSPHLSMHNPFTREGCLIFVKVGHLA